MSATEFKSTYGLRSEWSYRGEEFKIISLSYKLGVSRIEALKIRIAKWKPKTNRNNQAIFYFDVETHLQAQEILKRFIDFDFKKLEKRFDSIFELDNVRIKNTGETQEWLSILIPKLRSKFNQPNQ